MCVNSYKLTAKHAIYHLDIEGSWCLVKKSDHIMSTHFISMWIFSNVCELFLKHALITSQHTIIIAYRTSNHRFAIEIG